MADYTIGFKSEQELAFAEEAEVTALMFALIFSAVQMVVLLIADWARTSMPLPGDFSS